MTQISKLITFQLFLSQTILILVRIAVTDWVFQPGLHYRLLTGKVPPTPPIVVAHMLTTIKKR